MPPVCRSGVEARHALHRALGGDRPVEHRGLDLDADPTDEVKADQKEFFRLLYNLLVGKDRGPRLPTLIVALGTDRVRALLTGP